MLTYVLFCPNLSSLDRDYQTIETEFESRVKTLRYPNLTQCDYIQNQLNQKYMLQNKEEICKNNQKSIIIKNPV